MIFKGFLIIIFISSVSFGQNKSAVEAISQSNSNISNVTIDSIKNHALTKDFVLGKFDYINHELFTIVHPSQASKTIYLNKEVYLAFLKMHNQAKTDGITLKIISGTRNFAEQKAIWERKWKKHKNLEPINRAKKILEYSAMPSTSRHHWGTDIDLNSFTNSYFEKGQGKNEYDWLLKNANSYGFYQMYTNRTAGRTGYNLERWHWSYMPLANKYLSYYNKHVDYSDILGFDGSELAKQLKTIPNYVNCISNKSKRITQVQK
ncbi:M15 family metallopeptidase [Algibacter sp.]|nr:M15 family metallopeptidase [Algibacter sp.]